MVEAGGGWGGGKIQHVKQLMCHSYTIFHVWTDTPCAVRAVTCLVHHMGCPSASHLQSQHGAAWQWPKKAQIYTGKEDQHQEQTQPPF
jgi:hypothetical protein